MEHFFSPMIGFCYAVIMSWNCLLLSFDSMIILYIYIYFTENSTECVEIARDLTVLLQITMPFYSVLIVCTIPISDWQLLILAWQ